MDQIENPIGLTADVGVAADIDERREMPRCDVDVPATLVVLSSGITMLGRMTEISLSGCRIILPRNFSNIVPAAVEFTFRLRGVAFRLGGIVEWAENNLAGMRFSTMSFRSRDNLMEVLCEVELENNAKLLVSRNSAVETPAANSPPSQTSPSPAVPAPARSTAPVFFSGGRSDSCACAAKACRSNSTGDAAAQGPRSPHRAPLRRRHFGHHRPGECGVETEWEHFVDLSIGGCRVRTAERFPVGIYTRIETEFKLHGLPFRLGGVIQAIHDRNTVGIRFLDLSQRKKDQVAELVAEMEEGA